MAQAGGGAEAQVADRRSGEGDASEDVQIVLGLSLQLAVSRVDDGRHGFVLSGRFLIVR